jgi:hypothetical protein
MTTADDYGQWKSCLLSGLLFLVELAILSAFETLLFYSVLLQLRAERSCKCD